jgi:hypothetical protein
MIGLNVQIGGEWTNSGYDFIIISYGHLIWVIKSRGMRWSEHVARVGDRRGAYRILVGKPQGKRPFGKPRYRWENNIKMVFKKSGESVDWIDLTQDRNK